MNLAEQLSAIDPILAVDDTRRGGFRRRGREKYALASPAITVERWTGAAGLPAGVHLINFLVRRPALLGVPVTHHVWTVVASIRGSDQ